MKQSILFLMAIALLLGLVACTQKTSSVVVLVSPEELTQFDRKADIEELAPQAPQDGALILNFPDKATHYNSQEVVPGSETGPEIHILQPLLSSAVTNPMAIQVEFKSRHSSSTVNMHSLKLTYKKFWGIDLTDRVIDYIEGESINVPEVELPEGEHTLEIYIEDSEENVSTKLITVEVAGG